MVVKDRYEIKHNSLIKPSRRDRVRKKEIEME